MRDEGGGDRDREARFARVVPAVGVGGALVGGGVRDEEDGPAAAAPAGPGGNGGGAGRGAGGEGVVVEERGGDGEDGAVGAVVLEEGGEGGAGGGELGGRAVPREVVAGERVSAVEGASDQALEEACFEGAGGGEEEGAELALVAGHDDEDSARGVVDGRAYDGEGDAGFGLGGLGGFIDQEGRPVRRNLGAGGLAAGVEGFCDAGLQTGEIAVGDSGLDEDVGVSTRSDHDSVAHQLWELRQGEQVAGRVAIGEQFSRHFGKRPGRRIEPEEIRVRNTGLDAQGEYVSRGIGWRTEQDILAVRMGVVDKLEGSFDDGFRFARSRRAGNKERDTAVVLVLNRVYSFLKEDSELAGRLVVWIGEKKRVRGLRQARHMGYIIGGPAHG